MCRSDWECDCHLLPRECPRCDGTRIDPDDDDGICPECAPYEPDEPEFDPYEADRMAHRTDDARWAAMP